MTFYAVKKGRKTGIYATWTECEEQVKGYPDAKFKKFRTEIEAQQFIAEEKQQIPNENTRLKLKIKKKTQESHPLKQLIAYVDGSYNVHTSAYGYGCVIMDGIGILEKLNGSGDDEEMASMRNVAGEILGCMVAVQYAIDHDYESIAIYYDYEGIEKWANNVWKAKKTWTKGYKSFIDEARTKIKIDFVKVAAHTGDTFNDMADRLAKDAIGVK